MEAWFTSEITAVVAQYDVGAAVGAGLGAREGALVGLKLGPVGCGVKGEAVGVALGS